MTTLEIERNNMILSSAIGGYESNSWESFGNAAASGLMSYAQFVGSSQLMAYAESQNNVAKTNNSSTYGETKR